MKRALLLVVACGSSSSPKSGGPAAWTGDSLYTLVDGDTTVGVEFDRPQPWRDTSDAHAFRATSSSGGTVEIALGAGDVPACALHLTDDDAPYQDGLARRCASLTYWRAPDPSLTWTVTATPDGNIVIAATNHGTAPVTPPRDLLHFVIDGKDSPDFAEAFGNGFTKAGWRPLAPGATVDDARGGMSLGGPGDHTVVLTLFGHEVARTTTTTTAAAPDTGALAWMGPSRFTLDAGGGATISFSFDRPQGWKTDADDKHMLLTSPAGGTVEVKPDADPHVLFDCAIALSKVDERWRDALSKQCDNLVITREPDPRITWKISVAPDTFALADQGKAMITISAANTTKDAIAPWRDELDIQLDGAASTELGMAFGNGGRAGAWQKLPGGQTVDDRRDGFTDLFAKPGEHVLALVHLGHEVARTTVHVK